MEQKTEQLKEPLVAQDTKDKRLNPDFDIKKKTPKIKEDGFVQSKDRERTDFGGTILLIPTMIIFAIIGCDGYINGNTMKLTAPYDGAGNFCGVNNEGGVDMTGYPYLMVHYEELSAWSPPTPVDIFKKTVCAKECPVSLKEGETYTAKVECKPNQVVNSCPTKKYLATDMMKICVPSNTTEVPPVLRHIGDMVQQFYGESKISGFLNDLQTCYYMIIGSVILSFFTCIVYIRLMSIFAEIMSWISIILVQISLIAASIGSLFLRSYVEEQKAYMIASKYPESMIGATKYALMGCYVLSVAFVIFAVVYAVSVCSNYKNLKFAINVIDAAADFLADNGKIHFSACLFNTLCLMTVILGVASCFGVYSEGDIKVDSLFPQYRTVTLSAAQYVELALLILSMIWIKEFFEVMNMFIVMHTSVTYYHWKGANESARQGDIAEAYNVAFKKHTGSVAVGAPIITFVGFLKMIVSTVSESAGNTFASANAHLSEEVFAYIAVSGHNFCSSSSDNYVLQNKHQKRFNFTNKIAKIFVFLGKVTICFINVWLTRISMQAFGMYDNLAAPTVISVFIGVLSFINASMFLSVFDAAVIGLMSCAAIDMDNHDGVATRGPPTFHDKIKKIKEQTELDDDGHPVRIKKVKKEDTKGVDLEMKYN